MPAPDIDLPPTRRVEGEGMHFVVDGHWRQTQLDCHKANGHHRVRVLALRNLERVEGLYFVRASSLRTVWNYLRDVGLRGVTRKITSRRGERFRNEKYISCGLGRITEPGPAGSSASDPLVVFLAPAAPACADYLVLPRELVMPVDALGIGGFSEDEIRYVGL